MTMKLNINIAKHSKLIARYLANEMSSAEHTEFEKRVNIDKENEQLIANMKKDWEQVGSLPQHQPNVNKAWNNLYNKLESEELITQAIKSSRFVWTKIAATIALLIIAGSLLFMSNFWSTKVVVESAGQDATLVHALPDGSI
ncbi:MAG TPA: hypothetical protein DG754_02460, partial [Bacteroidales bacterium]|nr:hypothetical protein [Bacteroidales bacterium]